MLFSPETEVFFFSLGNYGVTNFDCSSGLKHAQHHGLAPLYYLGKALQGKTKCFLHAKNESYTCFQSSNKN